MKMKLSPIARRMQAGIIVTGVYKKENNDLIEKAIALRIEKSIET